MSIQRDVDPVKDKQVNKMLDDKYGKQTKRIITGDDLRTIKALLVQKALEKRAITKHPGHADQSVHGKKGSGRERAGRKPKAKGGIASRIASRIGRAKSRVTRALRTATPVGMARAGAQFGETLRHKTRRRKMTKTEQVNSIMKRMREIIKAHTR